ncbi:alpha-L-arabinofuranosidase C-terminal domain-containing protein [Paenibacillus cymbidii]|uniref:alpha-L-arabinofuranosidase C-terminal domain-containing protein n=1 Tax=Paenibacillus cymbidii TaxID=1639034 RepID=UPI002E26EC82
MWNLLSSTTRKPANWFVFAVNRSETDTLLLDADIRSFAGGRVISHIVYESGDRDARNTEARPNAAVPHERGGAACEDGLLRASLPKLSWNVIRVDVNGKQAE